MKPIRSLSWDQISAWRLQKQHLQTRCCPTELHNVTRDICGLHAQVMSCAELTLWARVDGITRDDVQEALWDHRSLVKAWAMRGTLHLFTAADFPLYAAALRTRRGFLNPSWLKFHGLTMEDIEAVIEGVRIALDGRCLTREELGEEVVRITGLEGLRAELRSGWGGILKPAAYSGYLCFGPMQGRNVTFVRPDGWLNDWYDIDPEEALREIARRYLTAYGPLTRDELARWWGMRPADARVVLDALAGEIEEVEVAGRRAWALAEHVEDMASSAPRDIVRLLPGFDQYVVSVAPHVHSLLPGPYKDRIYRTAGWVSPVVLVDGRIEGVWRHEKRGSHIALVVEPFASLSNEVKRRIADEAERLGAFLLARVDVAYGTV